MKKLILPLVFLVTMGAGCATADQPIAATSTPQKLETTITYYVAQNADVRTQFCNGADMDSAGYKNAVATKQTKVVPGKLLTFEQIKAVLKAAAAVDFADSPYTLIDKTTFDNGVVTLHPAGGWAGSSIFLCAWKPFAEKQLEQFPEVKSVKWEVAS